MILHWQRTQSRLIDSSINLNLRKRNSILELPALRELLEPGCPLPLFLLFLGLLLCSLQRGRTARAAKRRTRDGACGLARLYE